MIITIIIIVTIYTIILIHIASQCFGFSVLSWIGLYWRCVNSTNPCHWIYVNRSMRFLQLSFLVGNVGNFCITWADGFNCFVQVMWSVTSQTLRLEKKTEWLVGVYLVDHWLLLDVMKALSTYMNWSDSYSYCSVSITCCPFLSLLQVTRMTINLTSFGHCISQTVSQSEYDVTVGDRKSVV